MADRGRIAREVIAAYNIVNGTGRVDQSGRRPAAPTTIEAIERLKTAKPTGSDEINSTVAIVDEDGREHSISSKVAAIVLEFDRFAEPVVRQSFDRDKRS